MKDLQIFRNREFGEIRSLDLNNEPYFVGIDIAKSLGYTNPQKALRDHVDEEDKGVNEMDTPGGKQKIIFINESGLYSLIMSSKLPSAKKFKRWVTGEVLPTIRKHGTYTIRKRHKPIDKALKQHFNIAETISNATGIKPELAYAVAINEAEKETGYSYDEYKKLLPSAEHEVASFNPTQLGEKLGGIPAKAINTMLSQLGLQVKKDKTWRITEEGKKYGEEKPYSRNGHTDYRPLWNEKVIEVLGGKCGKNNRSTNVFITRTV